MADINIDAMIECLHRNGFLADSPPEAIAARLAAQSKPADLMPSRPVETFTQAGFKTHGFPPAEPSQHRPGCDALGGYGHGVGACTCGAEPAEPSECPHGVPHRYPCETCDAEPSETDSLAFRYRREQVAKQMAGAYKAFEPSAGALPELEPVFGHIEAAIDLLEAIPARQRQIGDVLEPVRTIADATKLVTGALHRLSLAGVALSAVQARPNGSLPELVKRLIDEALDSDATGRPHLTLAETALAVRAAVQARVPHPTDGSLSAESRLGLLNKLAENRGFKSAAKALASLPLASQARVPQESAEPPALPKHVGEESHGPSQSPVKLYDGEQMNERWKDGFAAGMLRAYSRAASVLAARSSQPPAQSKWPIQPLDKVQVRMPDGTHMLAQPVFPVFDAASMQELEDRASQPPAIPADRAELVARVYGLVHGYACDYARWSEAAHTHGEIYIRGGEEERARDASRARLNAAIDALAAAPAAPAQPATSGAAPERVQPRSTDHHIALREAHGIKAEDDYFAPRPVEDSVMGRRAFSQGFARGFDSAEAVYRDKARPQGGSHD